MMKTQLIEIIFETTTIVVGHKFFYTNSTIVVGHKHVILSLSHRDKQNKLLDGIL